jgi:ribonucleoside-triphosphate reductase
MLARAVKKEYALTQVFSDQVTLAHLTGDLHLNELAQIDRLHSAEHSLAGLVMHDSPLLGIPGLGGVPDSPDMLLAQLVKFNDILDALFSRCAGWYAFNFMASPFVEKLNDNEMRRFAAMLLHECAYRHTASAEVSAPMRISLNWKAPENMAALDAAGGAPGRTYKQYEVTARRFAWALLQAFYEGGINDADFPSPRVEVVLDDAVLNTFEGTDYLRHAAKVALRRPNVYFLFLEKNCCEPALLWQPRNVVWHRVALNLPRAAIKTGANDAFYAELNRLCLLACEAHQQKRDFIETLLDPVGNAPLAPLALEQDGKPYIIAEDGLFVLDLEGLGECAMVMCGTGAGHTGERIDFMEQTVEHMKHEIGKISRKTGMHCILSANTSPEIGNRFATLDTANYPQLLQKIAKIDTDTQAITYTQGISLDDGLRVSPYDKARMEGMFQQHLGEANYSVLKLGLTHASVNSLCDLLTMIARQTTCDGVYLML